jgi:cation:H+ antiporter
VIVGLELVAAFVLIVGGAIWFTNAVEWLGHRLDLGAGAVGALLAAVGTALPESIIPIVALLGGATGEQVQLAYGAIIGAPFMLATIAMLLIVGSAFVFRRRREQDRWLTLDVATTRRDLGFFLALFPIGVALGALGVATPWRIAAAVALLGGYALYVRMTVARAGGAEDEELRPLFVDTSKDDPPSTLQIALQFMLSLAAIVGGAELFVTAVEDISHSLGVPLLVLALILAPRWPSRPRSRSRSACSRPRGSSAATPSAPAASPCWAERSRCWRSPASRRPTTGERRRRRARLG